MYKQVHINNRPKFCISCDRYQWILYTSQDRKSGNWSNGSYFATLSLLLDDLAEVCFKKFTPKNGGFEGMQEAISKTYNLITEISKQLKTR